MTQNPSPHPYNNHQQFAYEADFNDSKVMPNRTSNCFAYKAIQRVYVYVITI